MCALHNFSLFVIFLPKIIKIYLKFDEGLTKQICTAFLRHCVYLTSRRCSGSRDTTNFRKVRVTLHVYISKTVSHTKNTLDTSTISCNAQIRSRPKDQRWSTRTGSVPKNPKMGFEDKWPFIENISQFCSKKFMTSPIHVLCSNLKETGRGEMGKTMFCFGDKKFSPLFCARLAEGAKSLQGILPPEPTFSCKI